MLTIVHVVIFNGRYCTINQPTGFNKYLLWPLVIIPQTPVVPKLFWCADHLKYFTALRKKILIYIGIDGPLELISQNANGPPSRLWELLPYPIINWIRKHD
jgi:hypothetical protein